MFNAMGFAFFLATTLQGAVNRLGWAMMASYGLLSVGYRALTLPP